MCGLIEPGLAITCPRSISSRWIPRRSTPTLSPARPSSSCLRNISTPVTTAFWISSLRPTISTSSLTRTTPRSIRPEATVPRPVIENTSSTGSNNGLSVSRSGSGMYSSTVFIKSMMMSSYLESPSRALRAEPWITGRSSPGKSYSERRSRISISTNSSNSSSSTKSTLFMKTIKCLTPT